MTSPLRQFFDKLTAAPEGTRWELLNELLADYNEPDKEFVEEAAGEFIANLGEPLPSQGR